MRQPRRRRNPVRTPASASPKPRRPSGWTTLSGRGAEHQQERRDQLACLVEGTPCPFGEGYCGHAPMYSWQELDLDEFPPRAILRPGEAQIRRLSHARCNRQAGARLGNALRAGRLPALVPSRPRGARGANAARRARW